ncbi:hypothetical protein P3342_011772 [Pyrenophora teres f. teres]|uniref:DUF7730 domain-containing protein n=2 Tax=Pyrenophora teres f. teres TaxID=97479 RepID=E3SAK7_PYRTT|nr:hypothetical protein PTT_20212 [Pyrenophora teres f. teres 0-1]KAE8822176.1 hypothetical protein HRS9139_10439 [Pyrenophora teres f. teres]KAE8822485.1 hypothetical protein PTNB85_10371 [Pyrenophora teres f. teres]KAE8858688.1 hypothetical protein PTNB29_07903 [Pyrenophora teres f. teres]KAE8861469.1 hypothetical protein PTNB73_07023 [Pyrenophora teres f. teres]
MVKKVTYSRKPAKRPFSAEFEHHDQTDISRKRARSDGGIRDESRLSTAPSSRQGKRYSLLKKCAFGGPVSIPDADIDIDIDIDTDIDTRPRSESKVSILDKVIKEGKHQAAKPDAEIMRRNRDDFVEIMKNGHKRNSQLPTPPAEAQRKAQQHVQGEETFSRLNGVTHKREFKLINSPTPPTPPTPTSQLFGRIVTNEQPKAPYQPKTYKAEQNVAPRRTITGDELSKKSRESQLWSTNQTRSPFLQLPENVRSLIYKYALGGKTINIGFETYRTVVDPTRPTFAKQAVPVFKYRCTVYDQFSGEPTNPYRAMPFVKTAKSFGLLNNVCRQMYEEAATLPYKLNLICFDSHNTMVNFLLMEKRLSRRHLQAFTQILLPDGLPATNMVTCLGNVDKVYLAFEHDGKPKGWYQVMRRAGAEPIMRRMLK